MLPLKFGGRLKKLGADRGGLSVKSACHLLDAALKYTLVGTVFLPGLNRFPVDAGNSKAPLLPQSYPVRPVCMSSRQIPQPSKLSIGAAFSCCFRYQSLCWQGGLHRACDGDQVLVLQAVVCCSCLADRTHSLARACRGLELARRVQGAQIVLLMQGG